MGRACPIVTSVRWEGNGVAVDQKGSSPLRMMEGMPAPAARVRAVKDGRGRLLDLIQPMRLPIPERVTTKQTLVLAVTLLCVQLVEGTDLPFALLTFAYVLILAFSYNMAGGINYPSGAWILFTGLETALIGIVYKALLLQPGDANLQEPVITMAVYCAGLAGMGLAGWLSRIIRPKEGWLAGLSVGESMKLSAIGCLAIGVGLGYVTRKSHDESGTVGSALNQLNHFNQLAILLGTMYQIKKSGGKSSTNWVVWASGGYLFGLGLLTFSKEGMFTPIITWLICAVILRFDFSRAQVIAGAAAMLFTIYYLVPFSQAGRASRDPDASLSEQISAASVYLTDLEGTRSLYLEGADVVNISDVPHFYNGPEGIFDRLQMLAFDDALITITDEGNVFGLTPALGTFMNAIPRFIWPEKPQYKTGNVYGQQIGVLSENDETTGISFSPTGDAYHEAKWFGVIVILPLITLIMFVVCDTLSGDVRKAPWGLLFLALFAHAAPEGGVPGPIWLATYGAESVIFAALFSGWLMPYLSRLFTRRKRAIGLAVQQRVPLRPRRLREAGQESPVV